MNSNISDQQMLESMMKEYGISKDTILYRYQPPKYIEIKSDGKSYILAKESPKEIVIDPYRGGGRSFQADSLGAGLAFTSSRVEEFGEEDKICLTVRLEDVLSQGGLIYPVISTPAYVRSFFLTIPDKKVEVTKVD
jgi:hypothetical protein